MADQDLITLHQILACRESPLEETELWAVCQECCEVLINVDTSSCDLAMLSITPENIVFDVYGNVNLRILDHEGFGGDILSKNSGQALIYSLGMTLIQASSADSKRSRLSSRLERLLSSMTSENSRIGLDDIIRQCDGELSGLSSVDICCQLAALARNQNLAPGSPSYYDDELQYEEENNIPTPNSDYNYTPEPTTYDIAHSESQHGRYGHFQDLESPSFVTHDYRDPLTNRAQLRPGQAYSPLAKSLLDKQYITTDLDADIAEDTGTDIGETLMLDYVSSPDQSSRTTSHLEATSFAANSPVTVDTSEYSATRIPGKIHSGYEDSRVHDQFANGEELYAESEVDEFREMEAKFQSESPFAGQFWNSEKSNSGSPFGNRQIIRDARPAKMHSNPTFGKSRVLDMENSRSYSENNSPSGSNGSNRRANQVPQYVTETNKKVPQYEQSSKSANYERVENHKSTSENSSPNQRQQNHHQSSHSRNDVTTPQNDVTKLRQRSSVRRPDVEPAPTPSGRSSRATVSRAPSVQSVRPASRVREIMGSRMSRSSTVRSPNASEMGRIGLDSRCASVISADFSTTSGFPEGKTLQEALTTLGCNLEEDEIWALARECVLTVKETNTLPYMSSEHVMLLDNGQAAFIPVVEGEELSGVLPPESQQNDEITEKMCVFHLAATLWSAADYGLSDNQEPSLSQHLEDLLMTMTSDDPDDRPDFDSLMQTLNGVEPTLSMTSEQICWRLVQDVYNMAGETPKPQPPEFAMNNSICLEDIENDRESLLMTPCIDAIGSILAPNMDGNLKPEGSDSEEDLTPRQGANTEQHQQQTGNGSKSSSSLSGHSSGHSGSAFRPLKPGATVFNHDSPLIVPVKTVDGLRSPASNFPSALTSQATHFAPIPGPIEGKNSTQSLNRSGSGSTASTDQNMNKIQRQKKDGIVPPLDLKSENRKFGEGTLTKESVKNLNNAYSETFSPSLSKSGSRGASRNEKRESVTSVHTIASKLGEATSNYVIENYSPVLSVSICQPDLHPNSPLDQISQNITTIPKRTASSSSSRHSRQQTLEKNDSRGSRDYERPRDLDRSRGSRDYEPRDFDKSRHGSIESRDYDYHVVESRDKNLVGRRSSRGASSRSNTSEGQGYTAPESLSPFSRGSGGSAGLGKAGLIERLLSSEQSGRQMLVKRIASLLRGDLSTHGFIDNAGEDLIIAEYVLSLSRLKFSTFTSAILEKYESYAWSDELLHSLYSIVNGRPSDTRMYSGHSTTAKVLSVDEPAPFDPNAFSRRNAQNGQRAMYMSERVLPTYPKIGTKSKSLVRSDTDSSDSAGEFHNRRPSNRRSERMVKSTKGLSLSSLSPRVVDTENFQTARQLKQMQRRNSRPLSDTASSPSVKSSTDDYPPSFCSPRSSNHDPQENSSKSFNGSIHSKPGSSNDSSSNANTSILTSVTSLTTDHMGHSPPSGVSAVQYNRRKYDGQSVMFYAFDTDSSLASGDLGVSQDMEMIHTRAGLESKISDIEQQISVEMKMLKKSQSFYEKLKIQQLNQIEGKKAEQRNLVSKVHKQITATTESIVKLEEISRYLAVLYADQWGVEHILLASLADCPSTQPLNLQPNSASHLIQFTTCKAMLRVADAPSVQAGTPLGLMAHLFAKFSVSCGFVHEFFLCYRYFCTSKQVLVFILDKYIAALRTPVQQADNSERVRARAVDLLSYWMQAYYNLDFSCSDMTETLAEFMRYKLCEDEPLYEDVRALFEECYRGDHSDLSAHEYSILRDAKSHNERPKKKENRLLAKLRIPMTNRTAVISWKNQDQVLDAWDESESDLSTFSLMDYSNSLIAEQMTLLEQALFHEAHPVLFLDSKYHGMNVAMTTSGSTTNLLKMDQKTNVWGGPTQTSLFVGTCPNYEIIDRMLEHSQSLSHWVSAQILSSTSTKNQLVLVTKLVLIARHCLRLQNYATALSILSGFEQVIVRQLPVWRSLPAKCVTAMEELAKMKEDLKHSGLSVKSGQPAVPSTLLFLLQVQQEEHGAFTLANGMYKWTKIRKISRLVDQIRVCMSSSYPFEYHDRLVSGIQNSMAEYRDTDLQAIASQLPINIHKLPTVKLPQALRKVRKKLQGRD